MSSPYMTPIIKKSREVGEEERAPASSRKNTRYEYPGQENVLSTPAILGITIAAIMVLSYAIICGAQFLNARKEAMAGTKL